MEQLKALQQEPLRKLQKSPNGLLCWERTCIGFVTERSVSPGSKRSSHGVWVWFPLQSMKILIKYDFRLFRWSILVRWLVLSSNCAAEWLKLVSVFLKIDRILKVGFTGCIIWGITEKSLENYHQEQLSKESLEKMHKNPVKINTDVISG